MNHSDGKVAQYQRAVTPTLEGSVHSSTGSVRGKVLSYGTSGGAAPARNRMGGNLLNPTGSANPVGGLGNSYSLLRSGLPPTSGPGNSTSRQGSFVLSNLDNMAITGKGSSPAPLTFRGNAGGAPSASNGTPMVGIAGSSGQEALSPLSVLPRYDLEPLSEEIPADGIIFAKIRNVTESLVVFRTPEERLRNPERLNLDRRQLLKCPILEQEQRLRLLNYQNNQIQTIENLENLPNLIFLDFYNNKLTSLAGPLPAVRGLRVLMAGKNKISSISNLNHLKKLDVLDLHSNDISTIENLDELHELRVLNLAGNKIMMVSKLSALTSLTELNLRRNQITSVTGLDQLPALQRIFLSHNQLSTYQDFSCVFQVKHLIELSLDGNPLTEDQPIETAEGSQVLASETPMRYRQHVIVKIATLKHLDLKRITDEERAAAMATLRPSLSESSASGNKEDSVSGLIETSTGGNFDVSRLKSGDSQDEKVTQLFLPNTTNGENIGNDKGQQDTTVEVMTLLSARSRSEKEENTESRKNSSASQNSIVGTSTSSGTVGNGIALLAKKGQLPKGMSHIDIEVLSSSAAYHQSPNIPGGKALICVGDAWDWSHLLLASSSTGSSGPSSVNTVSNGSALNVGSVPATVKRLLSPVTEIVLVHASRDISLHRLFSNSSAFLMQSFPQLQSISIVHCPDILRVADLDPIVTLFQQVDSIRHISISGEHTPILSSSQNNSVSSSMGQEEAIRSYVIAQIPRLIRFNEQDITDAERQAASQRWEPLLNLRKLANIPGTAGASTGAQPPSSGGLISPGKRGSLGGLGTAVGSRLGFNNINTTTGTNIAAIVTNAMSPTNNKNRGTTSPRLGSVFANNSAIVSKAGTSKSFADLVQQLHQMQSSTGGASQPGGHPLVSARPTRPQISTGNSSSSTALLDRDAFNHDIDQDVRQTIIATLRSLQNQHTHLYASPQSALQINQIFLNNNNSNF